MARLSDFRKPALRGPQRLCCGTRRHSRSASNRLRQSSRSVAPSLVMADRARPSPRVVAPGPALFDGGPAPVTPPAAFPPFQLLLSQKSRPGRRPAGRVCPFLAAGARHRLPSQVEPHHPCRRIIHGRLSRAWLFGSYARMEEGENSDIDLLVALDQPVSMGLFGFSGLALSLEKATGKSVDLVVDGTVKPFAKDSIERDKVLIYERA